MSPNSNVPEWLRDEGRGVGGSLYPEASFIDPASWSIAQKKRWTALGGIAMAFMVTFILAIAFTTTDAFTRDLFLIMALVLAFVFGSMIAARCYRMSIRKKELEQ
ncbi:MAG: hypothetical protein KKE24_00890 [Candidatus Thermoplasmatota archaeon]|nr:hypothetical protein [Candidatus Thermoplasmatota archaeon]